MVNPLIGWIFFVGNFQPIEAVVLRKGMGFCDLLVDFEHWNRSEEAAWMWIPRLHVRRAFQLYGQAI